ncbi:MAG: hypothetical protein ACU83N_03835 [Gammaproteobacteria bacterium]
MQQFQVASCKEWRQRFEAHDPAMRRRLVAVSRRAQYRSTRLKPFDYAETVVIGYRPDKGRWVDKRGAIKVRTESGQVFFIGTGFGLKEREHPPSLGSGMMFRHQGGENGRTRFAVFPRIRDES